jgi:hypothetical protein
VTCAELFYYTFGCLVDELTRELKRLPAGRQVDEGDKGNLCGGLSNGLYVVTFKAVFAFSFRPLALSLLLWKR